MKKMKSNVEEARARKSKIIIIATAGDPAAEELADDIIYVPDTMELLRTAFLIPFLCNYSLYHTCGFRPGMSTGRAI